MEINRKNTNTFSFVSLIDRCSLTERERKKEEYESLRLVSLSIIYIYSVCVYLIKPASRRTSLGFDSSPSSFANEERYKEKFASLACSNCCSA